MKMKVKNSLYLLLLLLSSFCYGQIGEYNYKQEISGITDQWHKITIQNTAFKDLKNNLSDIRIFGIKANKDTIEVPYILKLASEEHNNQEIAFHKINEAHSSEGYFFTFEIPSSETINQINLDFLQANFDWKINLQASMNNQDWFTILEDFRILSIENKQTNYQFSKLIFPDSKYRYYRVFIPSKKKPILNSASISLSKTKKATYINFDVKSTQYKENQQNKISIIDVTLNESVAVSHLKIKVQDTFDYYRPITIKYLVDSIKTEKKWIYNYQNLSHSTLSSLEENKFNFNSTITNKIRIIINNFDNEPLTINTVYIRGYTHNLIARFTEDADYYLVYGNTKSSSPQYDISKFSNNIPTELKGLILLNRIPIEKTEASKTAPLFENKLWLWVIMGLIIFTLGWFSLKMISKKQ
ncbi:MAG: hypothetical protein COB12_12250 [Flavobacterium sp.]|nr:MAG: hypothetical protein COB12_12250 [Flavobacterium sp.]